jgi:pimeloyl-ACP methyl ester carboxylesterase
MVQGFEVEFDVSHAVGETAVMTGVVVLPNDGIRPSTFVMAVPGGNYDQTYWHPDTPSLADYSFSEHLADAGYGVIAVSVLGSGRSTAPKMWLTPQIVTRALDQVANQIHLRLAEGTLVTDGLPPQSGATLVGIGHSLGGMLVTLQQGEFHSYDRLGVLGYTAAPARSETMLTPEKMRNGIAEAQPGAEPEPALDQDAFIAQIHESLRAASGAGPDVQFARIPREPVREFFYGDFVPQDIVTADEERAAPLWLYGGACTGALGYTKAAASMIDVPVLVAFGEQDLAARPHEEPACFSSSRDVTLYILPESAHCHNLAPTRKQLWDRIISWLA